MERMEQKRDVHKLAAYIEKRLKVSLAELREQRKEKLAQAAASKVQRKAS
jgi:hypothetical protein